MKKKILCLALTVVMLLCCVAMFASCGECTAHVDPDGDGKCNNCGADIQAAGCTEHKDDNNDGFCDTCDSPMSGVGGTCLHEDINGDEVCDLCGQAYYLENPIERESSRATDHRVAKSQTQLK